MATFLDSPHPLLKEPTLYLADPPLHLKWGHLEDAFSSCGPIQPGGKGPLFVNSPCKQHAIHFADVFHAEMALATLQGAIVPNLDPPWKMALSHSPDFQSSTPQRRLFSQMVKSDTHPHPLVHGASLQTIFRWFRNAGPLVSVESTVVPGYPSPMVVIEYWEEEHANHARVQKKAIHPELLASPSFNLRTFDPANLYCAALGATCEHKILVDRFSQFGSIREATLKKIGVPEAYGFVSFWSRESAANALATMHGTAIAGNKITVRYYEPTAQNAFLTWFAGNPPPRTQKSQGGNSKASGRNPSTENWTGEAEEQQAGQRARGADAARLKKEREEEEIRQRKQREEEAKRKKQHEEDEAKRKKWREEDEARLNRQRDRQVRREAAEREESLARKKLDDAVKEEDYAALGFLTSQNSHNQAATKLVEAGQALEEAKRRWLEAMDKQASAARKVEETREELAEGLRRKQYAEAARWIAEREECASRLAREQIDKEEQADQIDEETLHRLELEESIRKIEELRLIEQAEKEEEEMRERSRREAEAAEEARRQSEARREEELRKTKEREELERLAREKAERARLEEERILREKQEREERERRDAANRERLYHKAAAEERNRCIQRDSTAFPAPAHWFLWNSKIALDWFIFVSNEFDVIKFGDAQPLTFESVPWPILVTPRRMSLDAIEWGAVEQFFAAAERNMNDKAGYKSLLEKAHRRFHPDKWRARGILNTVLEEDLRTRLEAAGNVVAQAITPLWLKAKQN